MSEESAMFRHEQGEDDREPAAAEHGAVAGGGALAVPETDPEQIAFKLWNEGRVDEAIRFLEQAAAAERKRRSASREEDSAILLPDNTKIEPVSDWRDRHRAALEPAKFNAYGSAVPTIDLVAGPGDGILPHAPRGRRRAGWILGIGIAALAVSAAGAFWGGGPDVLKQAALPFLEPSAQDSPRGVVATAEGERSVTEVALAPAMPSARAPLPTADAAAAEAEPAEAAADEDDIPPPDDEVVPEEGVENADESPDTAAPAPPDANPEELAEATTDPDRVKDDAAATPVAAARLPRQRPEPPKRIASAPRRIGAPPSTLDDQRLRLAGAPDPALRYFRRYSPSYDPRVVYYDPRTVRPLTPAENQILLARRAWAQDYAARRRAWAEWRMHRRHPWDYEPPEED